MSTIAEKLQASKNGLDNLLDYANNTTGNEDTDIGEAIRTLVDGYGQGGVSIPQLVDNITFTVDTEKNSYHFDNTNLDNTKSYMCILFAETMPPITSKYGLISSQTMKSYGSDNSSNSFTNALVMRPNGTIGTENTGILPNSGYINYHGNYGCLYPNITYRLLTFQVADKND